MKTHSITKILAVTAMMILSSCATRSHNETNLNGDWSSEGDIEANHIVKANIQQTCSVFDGTIRVDEYNEHGVDSTYNSGLASIVDGKITGKRGTFDIYSQRGTRIGSGTLVDRGQDLKYHVKIDGRTYRGVLWPVGGK